MQVPLLEEVCTNNLLSMQATHGRPARRDADIHVPKGTGVKQWEAHNPHLGAQRGGDAPQHGTVGAAGATTPVVTHVHAFACQQLRLAGVPRLPRPRSRLREGNLR